MTAEPTFGLLIPCKNGVRFLPRLFASVRAQTRPFDQIWLFDDGSSDGSGKMAAALGAQVLCSENSLGPSAARNRLSAACPCDWVHFHDADDLLDPGFLEKMSARADANTDVVICNARWFHSNGEVEREWCYSESELRAAPVPYLLTHPVGGINGLYRRPALEAISGYDENLKVWEDADLHVRLAANGARFRVVEESLVSALRREDSLSAGMKNNWRNRLAALRHYAGMLPADCTPALISELEAAARVLVRLDESAAAREAIALIHQLGGDPPTSNSILIQTCKRVFGAMAALRLQVLIRRT
ncbi:MAG TPA: glycosyltransferase family A protein [Opitutaceae bacterium]|jgi:glycosyltransferase involved in cell wall biosynthesis|nr:glycosyltransferase family A protein [Opitutaceae bacterium]